MYGALWRVLPGPAIVRVLLLLVLLLSVIILCFTVIFPQVAPLLPLNDASVADQ